MEKQEQNQPYQWILGIDVSKEPIDVCSFASRMGSCWMNIAIERGKGKNKICQLLSNQFFDYVAN